jgi:hypothetical protein
VPNERGRDEELDFRLILDLRKCNGRSLIEYEQMAKSLN